MRVGPNVVFFSGEQQGPQLHGNIRGLGLGAGRARGKSPKTFQLGFPLHLFLDSQVHLIIMWSVPYNLNIYNSYFGVGVVQLTTRFNQKMQNQIIFCSQQVYT